MFIGKLPAKNLRRAGPNARRASRVELRMRLTGDLVGLFDVSRSARPRGQPIDPHSRCLRVKAGPMEGCLTLEAAQ
jgi:hypothetical protein